MAFHQHYDYGITATSAAPDEPEAAAMAGLSFLWLEITGKCNLTCTHCYADSGPAGTLQGAMTLEDWTGVIHQASALGCRQLQFIGGEPTLHPDLPALIDQIERAHV